MKKILLLSVLAVMLCACSQQHKAEKMVKKYLKENLDDFKSYDPISFSDLQPIYLKDKLGEVLHTLKDFKDTSFDETRISEDSMFYATVCHDIDSVQLIYDQAISSEIYGWKIEHSYRASNKLGATEKYTEVFEFDKDMSEIW